MLQYTVIKNQSVSYIQKNYGNFSLNDFNKPTVRVYPGKSKLTMIGSTQEICQMLDWLYNKQIQGKLIV